MASTKKRKIINLTLIIVFVSLVLLGIGLGVYFFVKEKNKGLTVRQKEFGMQINNSSRQSKITEINLNNIPEGVKLNEVKIHTEDYLVTFKENVGYTFYGLKGQNPKIHSTILYDEVLAIYGNFVLLGLNGEKKIVDLVSGEVLVNLTNVDFVYHNDYLLLKSTNKNEMYIYLNNAFLTNLSSVLINTETNSVEFSTYNTDKVIDVNLTYNFLIAVTSEKTKVYSLDDFELILTLENIGQESNVYNVESSLNHTTYNQTLSYSVYEINDEYLLIERLFSCDDVDSNINLKLSNGEDQCYKLVYYIYDIENEKQVLLENKNKILRVLPDYIGEDYFALISSDIINKEYDMNAKKEISYYLVTEAKNGLFKLNKIISYNYNDYGKIIGFNGENLITTGGTKSTIIDFKANENKGFGLVVNEKINLSNYDKAIVVNSVLGQKYIYNSKGSLLVDKSFDLVAPFENLNTIALNGDEFYFVTSKGEAKKIDNFASQYADYVFMGIGVYFTQSSEGVNVYNYKNELLYSNSVVKVEYNKYLNLVTIAIDGEEDALIQIKPINEFVDYVGSEIKFNYVKNSVSNDESNSDNEEYITPSKIYVDTKSGGAGVANFNIDLNIKELTFINYDQLEAKQKALIPEFDDNKSYVSNNKTLNFDGVCYKISKNFVLAIIRLKDNDDSQDISYMFTLAFKDTYLAFLNAEGKNSSKENVDIWLYQDSKIKANIDAKNSVIPAINLRGKGLTNLDQTIEDGSRIVDYISAGYDGGLVLASDNISKLSLQLELSNIYVGNNNSSKVISLRNYTEDELLVDELDGVKVYILNKGSNNFIKLVAKDGYIISGFKVQEGITNNFFVKDFLTKKEVEVYNSCLSQEVELSGEYSFVRIKDLCVREKHSVINFYNGEEMLGSEIFFHGYGDGEVANSAYYGFENFQRKLTTKKIPSKAGYDFVGYKFNGVLITDAFGKILDVQVLINNYSNKALNEFNFIAAYEPKVYTIFYQDETPIPVATQVKFGQVVGELFDVINSTYNKPGYDFIGWFDNVSDGNEYVSMETIYNKTEDTILYARWNPKTYLVTFDANIETYTELNINGTIYNVTSALFAKDFNSYSAGSIFNIYTGVTKQVVFKQTYGDMPIIHGYYVKENNQGIERYSLIGWFDQKEVVVDNGEVSRGIQYDEDSAVTVSSAKVLYAHYQKDQYIVGFKQNNYENNIYKESINFVDKLIYGKIGLIF